MYFRSQQMGLVGRPNAGKSSLLNMLLGHERSIVTDEAGTTRDAIHSRYKMFNQDFILIDTAGIRKKAKVTEDVEFYSVLRSLRALEESDVCIIVIDAERGLESQDVNIISLAQKQGKGMVIMVNKWDLIEKDSKTAEKFKEDMLDKIKPITYVPFIFASVVEKQRIFQVIEKAVEVFRASGFETNELEVPFEKASFDVKNIEADRQTISCGCLLPRKWATLRRRQLPQKQIFEPR